jgi:hypothetical protein
LKLLIEDCEATANTGKQTVLVLLQGRALEIRFNAVNQFAGLEVVTNLRAANKAIGAEVELLGNPLPGLRWLGINSNRLTYP